MKYLIIVVIIIIVIVLSILVLNNYKNKNYKIENIKSISYSGITGMSMYSNYRYEIVKKDGKYIATVKFDNEEEESTFEVEEKDVKELEKKLNEYKVSRWNGFDKVDKRVLDGYSFSFSIHLDNEKEVYAHGYMKYPKRYSEVSGYLHSYFKESFERRKK